MSFISIVKVGDNIGYTEMIVNKEVRSSLYHKCLDIHEDVFGFWLDYKCINVCRKGLPYNRRFRSTTEEEFPYNLLPDGVYFEYKDYFQGFNFYNVYMDYNINVNEVETILLLHGFEI